MPQTVTHELDDVRTFWNRNVCQTEFLTEFERGTREFYDAAEQVRYRYHYHIPPLLKRLAEEYPGGKLLEIGCSMGTDLLQSARNGLQVTGVDLTEAGIELARHRFELYGLPADLRVANAEHLDFDDATFDIVYSFGVLHHTVDTQQSINEVHRVLKPGGKAAIMLYHSRSLNQLAHLLTRTPADGNRKDPVPIARTYSKRSARELFDRFSDVSISVEYLFGTGWGAVNKLVPLPLHRWLGRRIGWHLMIEATK